MASVASAAVQANRARIKAVPWKGWQALVVFIGGWIVLPLIAVFTLAFVGHSQPVVRDFLQQFNAGDPGTSFVLYLFGDLASLALIGYFLRRSGATWSDLGLRRFSFWRAVLTLVGMFAAFILIIGLVYAVLTTLWPQFNANQPQTNEFTGLQNGMSLWALVIIPPLIEEPIFRGFMFPAFAKRFGLPLAAIFTSLLFGFAHLQGNVSVYTFVLSLLLCWLYTRTGSIVPGIGLHMLNNYLAYTALTQK